MSVFSGLFIAAVVGFTLAAAISDLKTRRLPNWLNVSAFAAAVIVHTVFNGLTGLGFSLLGFATGFGILFVLWLIGGGGGGDVKLMGAVGAWLGAALTLKVFLVSAVLIAILCFAVLIGAFVRYGFSYVKDRYLASGQSNDSSRRRNLKKQRQRYRVMPYAVPVALSTWLVLAVAWTTSTLPL
jgi:prepilin peptidase CpaA